MMCVQNQCRRETKMPMDMCFIKPQKSSSDEMRRNVIPAIIALLIMGCVFVIDRILVPLPPSIPGSTVKWAPWAPPSNLVPWSLMPDHKNITSGVAFVIMASLATRDLHLWQRRTWLRDAKHVWAFSDYDDGIYTTTLPSLKGKGTWKDAQHRQLRGMQWLTLPAEIRWVFMIDDDTWVNMPVLRRFLGWLPSDSVMMCGYRAENNMFNGGGGILISRRLFDVLVPKLYSEQCPFLGVNDNTVTECARTFPNVTLMHSSAFSFYPEAVRHANDFIGQVTMHPVKNLALIQAMTATVSEFYKDQRHGD